MNASGESGTLTRYSRPSGELDLTSREVADTQTDSNGRFSLVVLDGLKGRLSGYILTRRGGQYRDCPKIEKFIKTQDDTFFELHTNVIKLDINMDYRDVELKFPFPYCAKVKSPQ